MTKEQLEQRYREVETDLQALRKKIGALEPGHADGISPAAAARWRSFSKGVAVRWIPAAVGIALVSGLVLAQTGNALFIDERGNVGVGKSDKLDGFQVVLPEGNSAPGSGVTVSGGSQGNARMELRNNGSGTPYIDFALKGSEGDYDARIRLMAAGKLAVESADLDISGRVTAKMGAVPEGAIVMWSGQANQLPEGWVLCDGANGTPDLRGRFIVGFNPEERDYARVTATGGEAKHALTAAEMGHIHTVRRGGSAVGAHSHKWAASNTTGASANVAVYGPSTDGVVNANATAHENRPPYMVLAYIMYTGKGR